MQKNALKTETATLNFKTISWRGLSEMMIRVSHLEV